MKLNIKIYLDYKSSEWDIEYPPQNKISFHVDPGDRKIKINKITLNNIETNIYYNTPFSIDNSDAVLHSVHEISKKGVFTLQLDDLYIRSHRANHWHCSNQEKDFIFQYEFTRDSFMDAYRDRNHKGFDGEFIPCFGCSFTYGWAQPETDTWPHLLSEKTGLNFLNMGVNGIGIDGIYNNLKLLHKKHKVRQCFILLPNFIRRLVTCKLDDLYVRIPSTVDIDVTSSDFHFFRDERLRRKMEEVKQSIIKDDEYNYSKEFLNKIIDYCSAEHIDLSLSSWDMEVYEYLKSKNVKTLPIFTPISMFEERGNDGTHPHRKHYDHFANQIIKIL